jgi:toxin ParE1/3/4
MANYDLTEFAVADLKEIWIYFAEHNVSSAQKFVKELMQKFDLLAENPKMGTLRQTYIVGMRSFPYKRYVIFYFPTENGIEIYRVIHDARDIDDLFESQFEGLKP